MSGNTIGARRWTDGWMYAPMLPYRHRLVRCPECERLVWVGEQAELEVPDWRKAHAVPPMQRPTVAQYLSYLHEHPELDPGKTRYVRTHVWWLENHARREGDAGAPLTELERDNLRALASLMTPMIPVDRLELAEIHRELGELDTARQLLQAPFEPRQEHYAQFLRGLVAAGDTALRLLPDPRQG